jgi:hypothetical protein
MALAAFLQAMTPRQLATFPDPMTDQRRSQTAGLTVLTLARADLGNRPDYCKNML